MSFDNRIIFAPASMVGESGITVVRLSGKDTFTLISNCLSKNYESFLPAQIEGFSTHSAHHGYLFNGNEFIDEVVVTFFKGPNSYTGEDVAEISSHGGSYIYRKVNELLIKLGAYHAEPGEFSKRAYLNGKMDLAQAEAVSDLIKAKTDQANKLALQQLTGKFSNKINELREDLINYCSLLELELDFSEEGIDLVDKNTLLERVDKLIDKFTSLTQSYESGKIIRNGVNLAIIGEPNVGKSSIFNYFLNENRAIVSEIPGTTRDYLEEPLIMGGIQFNLVDTAGIRETVDIIEKEGVRRSLIKIDEADIILDIEDLTNDSGSSSSHSEALIKEKTIKVYNKLDLSSHGSIKGLSVSAKTGEKMDVLEQEIIEKARYLIGKNDSSDVIITNERHRDCLLKSCEYLVNAKDQIQQGGGNELISFEIRAAMESISGIIGKTANVDILNNIFTKFCIGK
ncbi:MAG: tRNA uridine-5-carboxymethylaminomethyl(34) synthesis GTPase MnmE [Ignavibacteria bacterium]